MRVRIELTDGEPEEIVIRVREIDSRVRELEGLLSSVAQKSGDLLLHRDSTEFYVPKSEILYFEALGGKVWAHTVDGVYQVDHRLFELEQIMPAYFVRISKSEIANIKRIASLHRELTGNGEITFGGCNKRTFFSRGYYKTLKDKIDEVRFGK
jgi:DNA-binding LytR/AlgR family response regulator